MGKRANGGLSLAVPRRVIAKATLLIGRWGPAAQVEMFMGGAGSIIETAWGNLANRGSGASFGGHALLSAETIELAVAGAISSGAVAHLRSGLLVNVFGSAGSRAYLET